jgi:hypothetical protein
MTYIIDYYTPLFPELPDLGKFAVVARIRWGYEFGKVRQCFCSCSSPWQMDSIAGRDSDMEEPTNKLQQTPGRTSYNRHLQHRHQDEQAHLQRRHQVLL